MILRRLYETIVAVENQKVLHISVCVCVRAWVGKGMRVRARASVGVYVCGGVNGR